MIKRSNTMKRSLEMSKQIYGDKPHPDVAISLNNLGRFEGFR